MQSIINNIKKPIIRFLSDIESLFSERKCNVQHRRLNMQQSVWL